MKKWSIPAKTFFLGEYAAIAGASAIILTTSPCFELSLSNQLGLQGIHPESPAGRWWSEHGSNDMGLHWVDPYQCRGGMGASSAQFLGAYLASMYLQKKIANSQDMLDAYLQFAWQGKGLRPSGYDVLAQSQQSCVYIDIQNSFNQSMPWPFQDVAFILLHTSQKLATHHHLEAIKLPQPLHQLIAIVDRAKAAFEQVDSNYLVEAVNAYYQQLAQMNLVAEHTKHHIESFRKQPDILAAKGCGAMGSDVILLLVPTNEQVALSQRLSQQGWNVLATSLNLHTEKSLIEKNY